jgi:hypothetical protein
MLPFVSALLFAVAAAAAPTISPPLTVQLIRRCPPAAACAPPTVVFAMKRETERIWKALGVQLAWIERLSPEPGARAATDLLVMLEEQPNPVAEGSDRNTLVLGRMYQPDTPCDVGVAHLWVAHVRRHIEAVHVHGVPLISAPTRFAQLVLARALGRTLAHEIGHYLLGAAHLPYGLMRAQFSARELLETEAAGRYGLDADSWRRLAARRMDRTARGCVIPNEPIRGESRP